MKFKVSVQLDFEVVTDCPDDYEPKTLLELYEQLRRELEQGEADHYADDFHMKRKVLTMELVQ